MKHYFRLSLVVITLFPVLSCNSQDKPGTKTTTASKAKSSATFVEGKDYTEFVRARVLDRQGFSQPAEAFSLLIPKGWAFDGGVMWYQPGTACAGNNAGVKATSPDGKFILDMLPNYMWSFSTTQQLVPFDPGNNKYCAWGEPMNAEAYFKNVFLRNELSNAEVISLNANPGGIQALEENNGRARQELMRYGASQVNFYPSSIHAKVKWSNGSEAIVILGVNIIETFIPNPYNGTTSKSFTSSATNRVVFVHPPGESERAANMLSVMMSSVRTNTAWKKYVDDFWLNVRQQRHVAHIGTIKMLDDQTRAIGNAAIKQGQQNLDNMDSRMRSWEATQQSNDRTHTNFIKTIREVETYRDETGRIELNSGYNHAWSRSDGTSFIMSDNPNFDPSSVYQDNRWKEMKKVQ